MPTDAEFALLREQMVKRQIEARGVTDADVLAAMREISRHEFVPAPMATRAYEDRPLPIGHDQTISQPYVVAWMSELLQPDAGLDVLEIGTGCGYQTAILARLFRHVYSIELVPELARQAGLNLQRAGIGNVTLKVGDGHAGWPGRDFPRILTAAAARKIPEVLARQLERGGRMVLPVGARDRQQMTLIVKAANGTLQTTELGPVAFVPMLGE